MKKFILPFFLLIISFVCNAQKKDVTIKEYFADAEFFFAEEEYVDALQDYFAVYKRGFDENANINYRIGICYLNIPGQKEKSLHYLLKACKSASGKYINSTLNEESAPLDAYLYLGNAYRVLNELDSAIITYNKYLNLIPTTALEEKKYTNKQIEACNIAQEFLNNSLNVKFTNLGKLINNSNSNHNCVVSGDGKTLIYMTKLPFYEAVFMSKRRGNNWSRPINITPQIMSDGDQYVTGISYDGRKLLLAKEDEFDSDIYLSIYDDVQWSKSKQISKTINSRFWESHASFSKDGTVIYFTSNRNGGFGEMDIYYSVLLENGNWSDPVNMGANINTELSEDSPFVTEDGNKLYFSSQGHLNMGGYDFFVSNLTDSGWSSPENLRYPLSTTDEDIFYFPWENGESGYMHRISEEGEGHWDIYKVELIEPSQIEEEITEQIIEAIEEEEEIKVEIVEPITIEISPVLFEFDNYSLTENSKKVVNGIVKILLDIPDITIRLTGYADALGPEVYNQKLSEKRAASVKNYLVNEGIEASRINYTGKGESDFIAINSNSDGSDNPEGRKYNRRVEFSLGGVDNNTLVVKIKSVVPESLRVDN